MNQQAAERAQKRRGLSRRLAIAQSDLAVIHREMATLGKAVVLVLLMPEDGPIALRVLCRAMRGLLSQEDQLPAKICDLNEQLMLLESPAN